MIDSNVYNSFVQEAMLILAKAKMELGESHILAFSGQYEGVILADMIADLFPVPTIFFADTGRHFEETYQILHDVIARFPQLYLICTSPASTVILTRPYHMKTSEAGRDACCDRNKAAPLQRVLIGKKGWLTGLRRSHSTSRNCTDLIEQNKPEGKTKYNPLADWPDEAVMRYTAEHRLPCNMLYLKGYRSIGCAPCTRPTFEWEDHLAGKWWWETRKEKGCGMHGEEKEK